jgi:hypothetical protein
MTTAACWSFWVGTVFRQKVLRAFWPAARFNPLRRYLQGAAHRATLHATANIGSAALVDQGPQTDFIRSVNERGCRRGLWLDKNVPHRYELSAAAIARRLQSLTRARVGPYQRAAEIGDRKSMTPYLPQLNRRQHHPAPIWNSLKRGIHDVGQRDTSNCVRRGTLRQGIMTAIAAAGIDSERATKGRAKG